MRVVPGFFLATILIALSGCFAVGMSSDYSGPLARPLTVNEYYAIGDSYGGYREETLAQDSRRTWKRITLDTEHGPATVDFFQRPEESDDLILVFPILGGNNKFFEYFAEKFVDAGYDAAIVHRNNDFKNPKYFDKLEEVLRMGVVRDRITLDFFEKEYGKKDFGGFGISRGGINVVLTAGADPRLKYNVVALGGEDLMRIMRESNEVRFINYRNSVMAEKGISEREFYAALEQQIRTDPKYLARYVDARNTLMFLGLLDSTVPIQYGVKLRQRLGGPKTIYLLADHYMAAGFTGMVEAASPAWGNVGFPFDYIESESISFFDMKFREDGSIRGKLLPFHILQAPFNALADIIDEIF